ncbi:zinc-ribbon domain-containing protein [Clostridium sp. MCC353]|uniref:zinc-ribbon domain-containing protein n=1 Tax=Clostridium sp. MCC353 TaxID=2592646 RepID=UPI001C00C40F|nr:zinc-ribbon domain-containing protein [Clostridium sp. MCC353]MBT9777507.1 zinc-ribbon domain-containing protein [Clostridium sp. MCC353]
MICQKCKKEIPDGSRFCPYCGKTIELEVNNNPTNYSQSAKARKKAKKITIMVISSLIVITSAASIFYYFKVYEGDFKVEQAQDTFEVGRNQELLKTLKYDTKSIKDITIADDGGFTTGQTGDYTAVFDVINNRRNHRDISFTYHVVDTTAPIIDISKNELFIAKGSSFDLEQYATAQDAGGSCTISYSGDFDPDRAGIYNISVFASDPSGNVSDKKNMTITVEDRDNCDIRNANFGESREIVKRYETSELVADEDEILFYKTRFNDVEAKLIYWFNSQDQLYAVGYLMGDALLNHELFISSYDDLTAQLEEKYGAPDEHQKINNSVAISEGSALWLGYYGRQDEWYLDNMSIRTLLMSSETNKITFNCIFFSKVYQADEKPAADY